MGNLITADELGKRLNLSTDTIRKWARAGIIPCLKLSGKVVRFDSTEVEDALRKRAAQSEERRMNNAVSV